MNKLITIALTMGLFSAAYAGERSEWNQQCLQNVLPKMNDLNAYLSAQGMYFTQQNLRELPANHEVDDVMDAMGPTVIGSGAAESIRSIVVQTCKKLSREI